MSNKKQHWVMDYETLADCFLGVFESHNTDEVHVFTICKFRNDLIKMLDFFKTNIRNKEYHISFNGIAFDSQITQFILESTRQLKQMSGDEIARHIYKVAQDSIQRSNNRDFQRWSEKKLSIKQLDIFKLNHWDNPAKRSSLKWIQCSMDWHNVMDMPIHHTTEITTIDELKMISIYCRNDVKSTKAIFLKNKKEIALRTRLSTDYGINLYSASEPRISKELFAHFLSKQLKTSKYELKQLRTERHSIVVKDLLLPYIEFNIPEFKNLLEKFKKLIIIVSNLKGSIKHSITYRGLDIDFGLGGVHGAKKGVFESTEEMIIMSSDVKSYYPNLIIRNKWSPEHLPTEAFCKLYEWFYDERLKLSKKDIRNYVYKLILNSSYGLSNDKHSFLYDTLLTMSTTINGQLSLMMVFSDIVENIPGAIPLMVNTDGFEIIIPRKYEKQYFEFCEKWEKTTQLVLEHDKYQKLILPDVNNYIGIFQDVEVSENYWFIQQNENPDNLFKKQNGKYYITNTKCKGRFEFKNKPLHKNKSFSIIPKALYHYFVHDISPEDTLKNDNNIFNYCGQTKCNSSWEFKELFIDNGVAVEKSIQKTLRYYISNKGSKIIKHNSKDNRDIQVEAGKWMQTIFNVYEEKPFEEYDINLTFYLTKIKKEIQALQPELFNTQLKLNF